VEGFQALLEGALADPDAPVRRLPILPPDGAERVLALGEGPRARYPDRALHQLFEERADRTPDARRWSTARAR
jgi:non-ribosomal peptide synthetase component F